MKPLHAWVDIRGQRIASAEDAFRLLREFARSKTQENLHYIGVDENGKVLFHQAKSSGAISYIGRGRVALRRPSQDGGQVRCIEGLRRSQSPVRRLYAI